MGEAAKIVKDIKAVIKISSKGNAIFYGPGGHRRNKIFPQCQLTPDLVQTLIDLNNTHDRVKVKVDVVDGSGKIKSILICGFAPGKAKDKAKGPVYRPVREGYWFRLEEVGCAESDWVYGYRLQYTVLADGIHERARFCTERIPYATEARRRPPVPVQAVHDAENIEYHASYNDYQHSVVRALEKYNNENDVTTIAEYSTDLGNILNANGDEEEAEKEGEANFLCEALFDDMDEFAHSPRPENALVGDSDPFMCNGAYDFFKAVEVQSNNEGRPNGNAERVIDDEMFVGETVTFSYPITGDQERYAYDPPTYEVIIPL